MSLAFLMLKEGALPCPHLRIKILITVRWAAQHNIPEDLEVFISTTMRNSTLAKASTFKVRNIWFSKL
jgi:hypothetical protein